MFVLSAALLLHLLGRCPISSSKKNDERSAGLRNTAFAQWPCFDHALPPRSPCIKHSNATQQLLAECASLADMASGCFLPQPAAGTACTLGRKVMWNQTSHGPIIEKILLEATSLLTSSNAQPWHAFQAHSCISGTGSHSQHGEAQRVHHVASTRQMQLATMRRTCLSAVARQPGQAWNHQLEEIPCHRPRTRQAN